MKKVSIKLVKEEELDYGVDKLTSPADAARVLRKYLEDADRKSIDYYYWKNKFHFKKLQNNEKNINP